jgi:hypothetical protein
VYFVSKKVVPVLIGFRAPLPRGADASPGDGTRLPKFFITLRP